VISSLAAGVVRSLASLARNPNPDGESLGKRCPCVTLA
jgi:hypothetical protein